MEWIGFVRCEKSRRDFVALIFALIAPVHTILHRVSCSYETIPNATKYYETDRNISLGSNGADWVCLLRKNPDVTSCHELLHRVSCSYEKIPNAPEHYEMHQNTSLGSNGVDQVR